MILQIRRIAHAQNLRRIVGQYNIFSVIITMVDRFYIGAATIRRRIYMRTKQMAGMFFLSLLEGMLAYT